MSYQLNKTNGTLLTDLIDGQIDTNSTNLVLVGRNYSGYGEYFNENFIKLLENFSNTAAPSNPLQGQTWWDSAESRLKVYDGNAWKSSGGPFVDDTRPQMVAGDLWIDNENNQMHAYDGSDLILVGPLYTKNQGVSGFQIESILDTQSRSRTVANLYIGGTLSAVISNIQFTPIYAQRITGLVTADNPDGIIYPGFNLIDPGNFKWKGTVESANALVTSSGQVRTADSFLPSTTDGVTVGTLTIQNSGGLTIGLGQNHVQKVVGPRFYFENQLTDHDISMRVKSTAFGSVSVDAIYVDASTARVGIFNRTDAGDFRLPEYTFDIQGDLRVTGNMVIEGDTTSVDVATLRVEDKNIEIAKTADGTTLTGANANNAGFVLDTSDAGQKLWTWQTTANAWTSNVNIDVSDTTKAYKIGGVDKLTDDTLVNVTKALDLDQIGTLTVLQVDEININSKTISSTNDMILASTSGIAITASGDINITDSQKITGMADPTAAQDAATKNYVDTQISTEVIAFSMDITGLGVGATLENNVAAYLGDLYPANANNNGKVARIHTTSYAGATVEGVDVESAKNISFIPVDSNGTQNESVVQSVTFAAEGASGTVILSPARALMQYISNGTAWVIDQPTSNYP